MPSASTKIATAAKLRFPASWRRANFKSRPKLSSHCTRPRRRKRSSAAATLPKAALALRCASCCVRPSASSSSASSCKCACTSSAKSLALLLRVNTDSALLTIWRGSASQNQRHSPSKPLPFGCLFREMFPALRAQRIEAGFAIVLAHAPLGADEFLVFQPLQREIERAVIDKEDLF